MLPTNWMRHLALRLDFDRMVEIILRVFHLRFAGGDPPMHGYAGFPHAFGAAGYQGMPGEQVLALGDQPIAAGRRQP